MATVQKREGVNRFELIDKYGRQYVTYDSEIYESVQDNGKTLKIFVKPKIDGHSAELYGADFRQ